MKHIIRTIVIVMLLGVMAAPDASAQLRKGEKSLGPRIAFVSENTSVLAGLSFQYSFSRHVRIAPEVACIFRHHDRDAFLFDLNVHMPFGIGSDKVVLYPLAGLGYSSWAHHISGAEYNQQKDVTTHDSRFGANFGAGFELRCSRTLKLSLEARYLLIKTYSHAQVGLGIAYIF
ncbi:MAG: outer membrane beta-barrel protein [Muribaculaceae bacterium]